MRLTTIASLLLLGGCALFRHQQIVIRAFGPTTQPIEVDASKLPPDWHGKIERSNGDFGPVFNLNVYRRDFRVVAGGESQ